MKKFYPIVRRNFRWELLLITLLIFTYPSICEATTYGANIVVYGNADSPGTFKTDWTVTNGPTFVDATSSSLFSLAREGNTDGYVFDYYLGWNNTGTEYITQTIDISDISTDISSGKVKAVLSGYVFRKYNTGTSRIIIEQLNASNVMQAISQVENDGTNVWQQKTITIDNLNTSTRKLKITLYAVLSSDDSGYIEFDGIDLKLYRWPTVTNTAASSITTNSALLAGNVTTDGNPANTERGVVYSTTNTNPTIGGANVTKVAVGSGSGIFSTTLSGLSGAQKYYYKAYATNTLGTVYGTVNNFTTVTPTVTTAVTNAASGIGITGATLNGAINANNHNAVVTFQYGLTTSYGTTVTADQSPVNGSAGTSVSKTISGLASSTLYHYKVVAVNTDGTTSGLDQSFTTATPVPEMDLKQSSTAIADGGSYDFGSKLLSSNTDIVFTIQNTGTSALTLTTPITIGGTNANQFSIQAQPTSPVAAAGSTTFTIRFSPTSTGSKSASISIGNNDSNENPYDLTITGQGYAAPTVTTGVQTINTQGVNVSSVLVPMTITTLKGSVNANNASTAVTFEYGTTTAYGTSITATGSPAAGTSATSVTCTPTLLPNTTYHFRVVGTNSGGTTNGADQTFTTPVIEHFTDETTDYEQTFTEGGTTFTMTGYLFDKYDPLGGYEGPDCFYDAQMISNLYNPMPSAGIVGSIKNATNNYYVNNFWIAPGDASFTFGQYGNVIIRGKRSGTTLFTYTLASANTNSNYAVNNNYTYIDLSSYSTYLIDELEFEVTDNIRYLKIDAFNFNYPAAFAPTVTTQAVSSIGATTATGNGNVTNLGNPNPTAYGICYGTTVNPTITGSKVDNGTASATGAYTALMTNLLGNTTYHLRAYATNASNTSYGGDITFTTLTLTTTWDGTAWSPSAPTALDNVIIDGTYSGAVFACHDLTINAGKQVTIASGTLAVGGNLTLKSDATNGTATLIDNGTVTVGGTTNVEQYLTSGRNWYISSPVSLSTGNVVLGTAENNLWQYNEVNADWTTDPTSTTTPLSVMKGFVAKTAANGVITFTGGTMNTGNKSITVNRTDNAKLSRGFNLVGNPYPSYVDWSAATKTNLLTTMWYRTQEGSAYKFYTYNSAGEGIGVPASVTSQIPPMQAFWVRVDNVGTGTLAFTNAMRAHQSGTNPLRAAAEKTTAQQTLRLQVSNGKNSDETVILFNPNASDSYDAFDSPKMLNSNATIPEIYTTVGNEMLVINGMKNITPNEELALGFTTGQTNTFTIKATEISNFDADTRIILKDKLLNTEQELTAATTYSFSSDPTSTGSRFSLAFKSATAITGFDNTTDGKLNLTVFKNANRYITITCNDATSKGTVTVSNALGQKLADCSITGTTTVVSRSFLPGVYMVTINLSGRTTTRKIILN